MNRLPVSGKNPLELVAADSPPEGEHRVASVAYLVLNNAPGLLTWQPATPHSSAWALGPWFYFSSAANIRCYPL